MDCPLTTTSDFSAGAIKEAAQPDKTPITLMNGEQLVMLLEEFRFAHEWEGLMLDLSAISAHWADRVLNCRPKGGHPSVHRSRPKPFWPVDAFQLVDQLILSETM